MEIRSFTAADWTAHLDAVAWPSDAPMISKGRFEDERDWTLVLDARGATLWVVSGRSGRMRCYGNRFVLTGPADARRFIVNRVNNPTHLIDFLLAGFRSL